MSVVLREPKRKHRSKGKVDEILPFPIYTERATGIPVCEANWQIYTGRFTGDSVIVEKLEDISTLYTMGYYGKGSLSRGCALLGRANWKYPPYLKESQWRRHKQWMELGSSNKAAGSRTTELTDKHNNKESNNTNCDKKSDGKTEKSINQQVKGGAKSVEQNITVLEEAGSECSDIIEVENSGETNNKRRKLQAESPKKPLKLGNQAAEERRTDQPNIEVVDLSSDDECSCSEPTGKRNSSLIETLKPECSTSAGESSHFDKTEVLVLTREGSEDEDYLTDLKPRLEHEPSHLSQEKLTLSLEEAMFLTYGLGCLRIVGLSGEEMSLLEIWNLFQNTQETFVQRYIAYHYFRSKGWVVKSGLKYGGDFVLYKVGPHLYHSSYIVVVQVVNGGYLCRDRRPMSWTQFLGLSRLSETAGKEVMLCQVIWPDDLQPNNLPSPSVISSFKVQEVLLRRWVASQDRTEHLKNRDCNANQESSVESANA